MGHSQELSEFKRGTVIGCHLCNKSICEMSLQLNIPRSSVGCIITKCNQLGKQISHEVVVKDLQTSCGLQISTTKSPGFNNTLKREYTNTFWAILCSLLCGNSLGMAL
ncbi:unnamed protein product, partial [Staurois parvus]